MAEEQQKILVVDDERLNINVLVDLLKPKYKMMAAKNGEQALKAVQSANPPDLILLDIMMPEMDGYEVCRRIKADENSRDIPIIFVTAMSAISDETKGLELGAVDYLTKPISPPIVQARVKTHLDRKRQRDELKKAYKIIESQKERMQEELNIGRDIQMSMIPQTFPPFPDRDEFSIHAAIKPAREVGGDFYDFFFITEDRLCFCVGDVSGKGVPAALFMAVTRTLIKALARDDLTPSMIMESINKELSENNDECMFATIFFGMLDVKTGMLTYTNAGHNPPYLINVDGNVTILSDVHGPMVGAMPGIKFEQEQLQLDIDTKLFIYTDGVTEAFNNLNEAFGDEKLLALIEQSGNPGTKALLNSVFGAVDDFAGDAEQSDDITVLCLRYMAREYRDDASPRRLTTFK
jgi:sigma-B regulation protein RsbU (phosphoserine phosphatase)